MRVLATLTILLSVLVAGCENKAATLDRQNCLKLRAGASLDQVLTTMGLPKSRHVPGHSPTKLFLHYNTPNLEGTPFSGDGPVAVNLIDSGRGHVVESLNCNSVW